MLEATVATIKDMKENPGEHLEELFSQMETNDCEHKGSKVEDFNQAQKNRFTGIKNKLIDNIFALVKEGFPEADKLLCKCLRS